jgi:hypothetical protein
VNGIHIEQGTAILFGQACAILALVGLLAYIADDLIRTKALLAQDSDEREREVLSAMLRQVGHIMLAERLREIARNYESPENVLLRQRLGRTEWKEGGTPLPALWLMALADDISPEFKPKPDGYVDPLQPVYNLAGERFQP